MYEIIDVTAEERPLEPMGSKPKFWFEHAEWGQCLFKASRPGSGEDWSEKLAERFAHHLGIPHARYELATYQGERGIVTPRMTTDAERLVHGNELLIELVPGYQDGPTRYRTPLHTVQAVFEALSHNAVDPPRGATLPAGIHSCADVLAGYLFLDALIGNTDRHHENWAAIEKVDDADGSPISLCPTFDHASSLGRNEPLERMERRLGTRDEGYSVEAYASRATSALYSATNPEEPVSPLHAYAIACEIAPDGSRAWCDRLGSLDLDAIRGIVGEVPSDRMPQTAKDFVVRMVWYNRAQLEELCHRR
jgi:hypothetical protein